MREQYKGANLAKKILAVISTLILRPANSLPAAIFSSFRPIEPNTQTAKRIHPKPQLVLKLSATDANQGKSMMHTSHSSHRSHSSHSSHSSHYSSSTPSYERRYTPTTTTPAPKYKSTVVVTDTTRSKTQKKPVASSNIGSRIIFKGCRGTDVKELQELLIHIGYDLIATGVFDELTKVAVMDIQTNNGIHPSGMVDLQTLVVIKASINKP